MYGQNGIQLRFGQSIKGIVYEVCCGKHVPVIEEVQKNKALTFIDIFIIKIEIYRCFYIKYR